MEAAQAWIAAKLQVALTAPGQALNLDVLFDEIAGAEHLNIFSCCRLLIPGFCDPPTTWR